MRGQWSNDLGQVSVYRSLYRVRNTTNDGALLHPGEGMASPKLLLVSAIKVNIMSAMARFSGNDMY